jgi:hypothetical protein
VKQREGETPEGPSPKKNWASCLPQLGIMPNHVTLVSGSAAKKRLEKPEIRMRRNFHSCVSPTAHEDIQTKFPLTTIFIILFSSR